MPKTSPSTRATKQAGHVAPLTTAQKAQLAALTAHTVTKAEAAARMNSAGQGVIAHLFEWNWTSIGSECTNVLGPAGYGGVQATGRAGF